MGIIITNKEDYMGNCTYCDKYDELRPYGKNNAYICFKCAMKPENKETTDKQFDKLLNKPGLHNMNIKNKNKK